MKPLTCLAGLAAFVTTAYSQSTSFCDDVTSICYQSYTNDEGVTYRVALPDVSEAPFDTILQVVSPIEYGWSGFSWGGRMAYNPLLVNWVNGEDVISSSRKALGYSLPEPNTDVEYTYLKGTGVNETHYTLTVRCRGCSQWDSGSDEVTSLLPNGTTQFAYAFSEDPVVEPSSNTSAFEIHTYFGIWSHDLGAARSPDFDTWVSDNIIEPPGETPTSSPTSTTTPSPTATSTPTGCPSVDEPNFPLEIAEGWEVIKLAGDLTTPRGIVVDSAGNLLVVENGVGITAHILDDTGCVASSKVLIDDTNLNHGIYLSADSTVLYASSMDSVWSWDYDPEATTVDTESARTLVTGMASGGHITRTILVPKTQQNLLVVSRGSDGNLDIPSANMTTQRAVVKVFDMDEAPEDGYDYALDGWQAGYGLRNEVGIGVDGNDMLWGVENSADDLTRVINGTTTDIHDDNPAEELNYLGDPSVPNEQWYGYPTCFTVWDPSDITDTDFSIGDQFVIEPNATANDNTCVERSEPPRLSFQAHSAPLDCKFDADSTTLYVTFHGSWNREMPTGFKVVAVPFEKDGDGDFVPVAAADSDSGYDDILWTEDTSECSAISCLRPVGLAFGEQGQLYLTSDAGNAGELFVLNKL